MRILSAFLLVGLLAVPRAIAGDDGVAGYWKVTVLEDGNPALFWLIQLENKGGKLTGTAEPLGRVPQTILTDARVYGDVLEYTLKVQRGPTFGFQGKLPKAGGKKILGSLARGTLMIPAMMEATSAKSGFEVDREIVMRTPNDPRVFGATLNLIGQAKEKKIPAKEVQEWVETALRNAENYGPRWQIDLAPRLVDPLLEQEGYADIAVEAARKTVAFLNAQTPLDARLRALTLLGTAYRKSGKLEQAKDVEGRVETLEVQAHNEYEAKALDFKVPRFPGRKAKGNRAVLVELFTGAQCPPCVGADLAFDALPKSFGDKDIVLLQYHLHVPRPDALTNADSEARADYYGDEKIHGTPTVLFNGRGFPLSGGGREEAEELFRDYAKVAEQLLDAPTAAQLQASASRKGDKVSIKAKVTELTKPGDKVKLRLALVEDWARYKGTNGMTYHHQVVRAFAGGIAGFTVKVGAEQSAVVDIEELRKSLSKYLDMAAKQEPFLDSQRPMRLRNLSVVAFVQNDANQEVLQAIQVPVRDE